MRVALASDHGGFELKRQLIPELKSDGHEVMDFGAFEMIPEDDYPDFVVPMAKAVANGSAERGIAICGSGVGACVAANKIPGIRAALITDYYSAHQGVEDDDMNIICLGGRVTGFHLSLDLIKTFLNAVFKGKEKGNERFERRLKKINLIERENSNMA